MRIVVVGATGNVGSAIVRRLLAAAEQGEERGGGHEVVGVARRPGSDPRVAWHPVDVGTRDARERLARVFAGADAVVHLAWLLQPNHRERVMARVNVGGLEAVLGAVVDAGVPHVVVASSVGAYSPGPKDQAVDEGWPTGGIHTSHYARMKAVDERLLDRFAADRPDVVLTRLRPGLVLQRRAGAELVRLFLGPWIPTRWLGRVRLPVVPLPVGAISQVVHADDLADAVARILDRRAGGAFNLATDPVVGPREVARALGAWWLPVPAAPVRLLLQVAWHLRLERSDPGWLDIALTVPVMSIRRAHEELEWRPQRGAIDVLREVIGGVADRAGDSGSPQLAPQRPRKAGAPHGSGAAREE